LTWQQLARAGKFDAAYALGRTVEHAQLRVADLLLFGDTARLCAEAAAALQAYAEVRGRDPGSDAAAVAAFASGRVLFDQRAAFREAARWFQTYLRERAEGPLAREAHGRLVESLERAGEHTAALRSAEQYLRVYPSGPHATFARTLLSAQ
jgi:TolA-binding protein